MGYEIYGLKENPFPRGGAILKPESTDPRENGSIFSVNARAREIQEFEGKFIGTKTSFEDRLRCVSSGLKEIGLLDEAWEKLPWLFT